MLPRRGSLPPLWKGKETRRGDTKEGGMSVTSISDRIGIGGIVASPGNPGDAADQSHLSLLVPIYRIIEKKVKVIDFEDIDRHHKRANQSALSFYLSDVIRNVRSELLSNCLSDYYGISVGRCNYNEFLLRFGWNAKNPPLSVVANYNKQIISMSNNVLIEYSKRMFRRYVDQFKNNYRCVVVTKKDNEDENFLIKLDNRYCQSYKDKVKRRMKWLCYKYGNAQAVLLTLTLDPKLYDNDKLRMWLDIKPQYHRFITALKYHFKKENRKFPQYICSIEAQSNGNPHLHIVFLGASRLIDWRMIRDLWHQGFIFINRTFDNEKIRYPINYITKYIMKAFSETTDKNLLTQSLSWLFNIRSFNCSRGLLKNLKPSSSGDWYANCLCIVDNDVEYSMLLEYVNLIIKMKNSIIS